MEHDLAGEHAIRVALHGRLDSTTVSRIEPGFKSLLESSGKHALIDLRDVGFAASMAIRMFIANARMLQRGGRSMVLYGAQPLVQEVFGHVALDELIPVVSDEAAALRVVASNR